MQRRLNKVALIGGILRMVGICLALATALPTGKLRADTDSWLWQTALPHALARESTGEKLLLLEFIMHPVWGQYHNVSLVRESALLNAKWSSPIVCGKLNSVREHPKILLWLLLDNDSSEYWEQQEWLSPDQLYRYNPALEGSYYFKRKSIVDEYLPRLATPFEIPLPGKDLSLKVFDRDPHNRRWIGIQGRW